MSKGLRDWMWITLWYSDTPDSDFGEDRPEHLKALGSPWENYKMCVVVDFDESGVVDEAFATKYSSLAEALAETRANSGGASWCSNPYLEKGRGNQQTNCIGCHQHGGKSVDPDRILVSPQAFPNAGRSRLHNQFPSDYLWSLHKAPELIGSMISERIKYQAIVDGSVQ